MYEAVRSAPHDHPNNPMSPSLKGGTARVGVHRRPDTTLKACSTLVPGDALTGASVNLRSSNASGLMSLRCSTGKFSAIACHVSIASSRVTHANRCVFRVTHANRCVFRANLRSELLAVEAAAYPLCECEYRCNPG